MSSVGPLVAVGRTSDVYEFGPDAVVKVPRPAVPAHWAAKEARLTSAVRELGAPVPSVLGVVQVDGRDAIVFERVGGQSMWEMILENPGDVETLGGELADVHRRILCAGLPGEVAGLVERMRSKIEAVGELTHLERTEALGELAGLPRGAALLHGDLHPGNVLMSPSGPVVIDWFDASIGHPVADVVRSSVLMRPLDGTAAKPHLPGANPSLLRDLHQSYVSAMRDVLARPVAELREWESVVVASRLAEDAEADESLLLELWRDRQGAWRSPLARMRSGGALEQKSQ